MIRSPSKLHKNNWSILNQKSSRIRKLSIYLITVWVHLLHQVVLNNNNKYLDSFRPDWKVYNYSKYINIYK